MSRKSLVQSFVFVLVLSLVLVLVSCSGAQATANTSAETTKAIPGDDTVVQSSGLSGPETSQPPKQEENINIVRISDILTKPDAYKDQVVVVKGKIISECGAGCWFTLNDGTGTIYVDLKPSNFVIPQKRGATAMVHGEVVRKSGDTYIIGKKVEF